MNRSQQVVEIYRELKRSVGNHVSSGEILACAASIVELFSTDDEPKFDLRLGGMPFDSWSIDTALADGGWRVMARELGDCDYELEDEDVQLENYKRKLQWGMWQ